MNVQRIRCGLLGVGWLAVLAMPLMSSPGYAEIWIFEPSIGFDQRFDDNYPIDTSEKLGINATRVVASLGLSRKTQLADIKGVVRVDGLLTQSDDESSELNSNRIAFIDASTQNQRSSYGIGINYKLDTPSRDISADITDIAAVASDTGASVTQSENVGRQRLVITPRFAYNLTRRTELRAGLSHTRVEHELPSAQDAIRKQFQLANPNAPVPDNLSLAQVGGVFTVAEELDDFNETAFTLGLRHNLSPIVTLSVDAGVSFYSTETEDHPAVQVDFDDKIPDANVRQILRDPKRTSRSTTSTLRFGYDRSLTPTLVLGLQAGIFVNEVDDSDLLREDDATVFSFNPDLQESLRQEALDSRITSEQGWLANISLDYDAGLTRYSARFGADVLPSAAGSQVESVQLTGDVFRRISPLMDVSLRGRAFEPDALGENGDDEFSRRFISVEPKVIWRYSRAWTFAASYRYRRQKSQVDTRSGESNAVLFSLKYTPPSAVRDAAQSGQ